MLKQGREPCLVLERHEIRKFRGTLLSADYRFHIGPRIQREGEKQTWVRSIGRGRQVHVQEVYVGNEVHMYAYTEPEARHVLADAVAAVLDNASYSGSARVLLSDVRARGRVV